ncbi:MAG: heterodisulfide reductase-related iron-sulfur binding cluster [Isosphaeraceae bacterium]
MYPETNAATARVLQQNGCEVVIPPCSGCWWCDSLPLGVEEPGAGLARQNLRAFDPDQFDAIIVNAAGCGAMLKDYLHILPWTRRPAARFVSKVKDISEFLPPWGRSRRSIRSRSRRPITTPATSATRSRSALSRGNCCR